MGSSNNCSHDDVFDPNRFELSKAHTKTLSDSSDDDDDDDIRKQEAPRTSHRADYSGDTSNRYASRGFKRSSHNLDDEENVSKMMKMSAKKKPSASTDSGYSTSSTRTTTKPDIPDYGPGMKILKNFGYNYGDGLGKSGQGRAEPVSTSTQHGRRGLGYEPASQGKPYEGTEWDQNEEYIAIEETPEWLDESPPEELDRDVLDSWLVEGKPKLYINDEVSFCDPKILEDILSLKTVFDKISPDMLQTLVARCNLYETIKNVFFLNRAAMKMANMDAIFNYMFTNPLTYEGSPAVPNNELLYFADVCAGPGGFTEYVLWRKKWLAKGFGFTLKSGSDFNISAMRAAPTESFYPYYGIKENGDIFEPDNLTSLKEFVLGQTDGKGVHFLMADGGFSVEGEENIQEIKSKQLYLCQCIAALSLVREEGHFVVKLFDIFTKFSIGLIYLMYRSFRNISIHKPVTSRPANSERYLICKWKRKSFDTIERHLFDVNVMLTEYKYKNKDIVELVPMEVLREDKMFFDYICRSNNRIGRSQIISLLKIKGLNLNPRLLDDLSYDGLTHEQKKVDIRAKCLDFWNIPDEPKKKDHKRISSYADQVKSIAQSFAEQTVFVPDKTVNDILQYHPKIVHPTTDLKTLDFGNKFNRYDWYFMFCSNMKESKFNFYLSVGNVYKLEGKTWILFREVSLPEGTLVYAERVDEKRGENRGIHTNISLHIIDAFRLGHENISNMSFKQRNQRIKLFCDAVNKPSGANSFLIPIRCKNIYKLMDIQIEIGKLDKRKMKNTAIALTAKVPNLKENTDTYFSVESMVFFKFTKPPWIMSLSKSHNKLYMFNFMNGQQTFNFHDEMYYNAFDGFLSSFKCKLEMNESYDFLQVNL